MPTTTGARTVATPDASESGTQSLYDADGWTWSVEQAEALRRRDYDAIDWDNVIEEIEDVGRRERDHWTSTCARALEHLLAIERCSSATDSALEHWITEAMCSRIHMARLITENPGLQSQYRHMFESAWMLGRQFTVSLLSGYDLHELETKRANWTLRRSWDDRLPEDCPYRLEDVAAFDPQRHRTPDYDVWPPNVARVLNRRLGADYPVQSGPSEGAEQSR